MGPMCIKAGCTSERCLIHCVYCSVDVTAEEPHPDECPFVSGVYPAVDDEICGRCGRSIDYFKLEPVGFTPDGMPFSLVVCGLSDCTNQERRWDSLTEAQKDTLVS